MPLTAFLNSEIFLRGSREEVTEKARALPPLARSSDLLVFDDETGAQTDLAMRPVAQQAPRRGRPSLGVEAREVTLLPRHWEWLRSQRGGASATLRKLVEEASRKARGERECRDAAYRFLSVMAGDLPGFEDAMRELYAGNREGYDHSSRSWPADVREHGRGLGWPDQEAA